MKPKLIGAIATLIFTVGAFIFWTLSIERCGLITLCDAHSAEIIGNYFAFSAIIIAIFVSHYKE